MIHLRKSLCLFLVLSACSGGRAPQVEQPPVQEPVPRPAPIRAPEPAALTLCSWLSASLHSENTDYADLRGSRHDQGVWGTRRDVSGFRRCEIESGDGPGLTPSSNCYGARGLSDLNGELGRLQNQVDQCITRQLANDPAREWKKGDALPSGLANTALWLDMKSWPRSVIVLKTDEGPDPLRPLPRAHLQVKKTRGASRF